MDELTTSIVGIDFPNDDKSKSNRRMECSDYRPFTSQVQGEGEGALIAGWPAWRVADDDLPMMR
jgi:hypothetical protein